MTGSLGADAGSGGTITIVRGSPTPAELAAVVSVLAACAAATGDSASAVVTGKSRPVVARPSAWTDRSALLRTPLRPGPGSWQRSAWR